ncbi:MAG: S8 family peptidase [Actinomycetota bacterium]|nr:S8 family peptidase [Actinomycetota bacterium]
MDPDQLERWVFGSGEAERYTQDSPVLSQVWLGYGREPRARLDLLLTPHKDSTAAELAAQLIEGLENEAKARIAYNESYVAASLTFPELVRVALPLSEWWTELWPGKVRDLGSWIRSEIRWLIGAIGPSDKRRTAENHGELAWLVGLIGRIHFGDEGDEIEPGGVDLESVLRSAAALLEGVQRQKEASTLWSVNLNRRARTAVYRSRNAIKADAATNVFDLSCRGLRWAVIDTGIDALHPAFKRRNADGHLPRVSPRASNSRIGATYDFTRLRPLIAGEVPGLPPADARQIEHRLRVGRSIDWDLLAPHLRVLHDQSYDPPAHDHGTHVAGILAGDWRLRDTDMPASQDLRGVCPDLELYDLRVFDDAGRSDEFAITAALQFVRHLNAHSDLQVIHGVNLSLSIDQDLRNYAVGRTPVCDECERLMRNGVVVVAAAGNEGQADYATQSGTQAGFRTVAITDPGNAEQIITVGSTHRHEPHTYGVSYFSSRGPTGDGRAKPDLVAPGEKILAPVPDGDFKAKDGTSQAAAHVSGAAALLLARHRELIGQPERVKQILCRSATDLGRERYFQGAGLVDVLRALQMQ